jgi:hypothetical protein
MNKKKIKGGIRLQPKDIKIEDNYKIDDITDVTYKKGSIETEEKITNGKKTFDLYKITDIDNYSSEEFKLPEDIQIDNLKDIYLFGYSGEYTQQIFVRKNASSKNNSELLLNHIGKNLKSLFEKFQNTSLNIILIYSENIKCLFIIFDMSKSQNKHYKKFEGLFSPAFFMSDEKLKKQINISDLKLLIDYTYKKISYASMRQKELDDIKTNLSDTSSEGKKNKIKELQNKIYEFEDEILKDSNNDNDDYKKLKNEINSLNTMDGGYKRKLKRKELNTLSLAELKQLHKSNSIKMNNNRNKIGLINNYIKNNVNN